MSAKAIWLASYPRSGNTLLRTVLYQCFGLPSASVYPNDLSGNKGLESYVGHIEHGEDGKLRFPEHGLPLIKTHELPRDAQAAVYVLRDGRAACVSLWEFYKRRRPLETVISGQHRFGTWAGHVAAWQPWARPNTLLLRYEDLLSDLPRTLESLRRFLGRETITDEIPPREAIANLDGRWVRTKSDWRDAMTDDQMVLFDSINGQMMENMGYGPNTARGHP